MLSSLWGLLPLVLIALSTLYAAAVWRHRAAQRLKQKFEDRYDLRDLREPSRTGWYDAVSGGPGEEPDGEAANEELSEELDEESGPYCISCGVGYPAGTPACRECGRTF